VFSVMDPSGRILGFLDRLINMYAYVSANLEEYLRLRDKSVNKLRSAKSVLNPLSCMLLTNGHT
jgi:hypothetical protein